MGPAERSPTKGLGFWIAEVICDPVIEIVSVMEMIPHDDNIKVVQDENSGEEEPKEIPPSSRVG